MADTTNQNKREGLFLGTSEDHSDIDLKAIEPNGSRPEEVTPTNWILTPGIE